MRSSLKSRKNHSRTLKALRSQRRRRLRLESLEGRRLLAVGVSYVNDNWDLIADNGDLVLSVGDTVQNNNDATPGTVTATYGTDAFGTVSTDGVGGIGGIPGSVPGSATINDAILNTSVGGTVNVLAGTYDEGPQIVIPKDVNIVGEDRATTIVRPIADTGSSGDSRGWFLVNSGVSLDVSNMTFDGNGFRVWQAFRHKGSGTFDHVAFNDIQFNPSTSYAGTAIVAFGGSFSVNSNVDVFDSSFSQIGRIGVQYFGGQTTGTFSDNTYVGKGVGDHLDYAVEASGGAVAEIFDNTISGNRGVASVDGSVSAGILASTFFGPGTAINVHDNVITDNTVGVFVGFISTDTSQATIRDNAITGNDTGVVVIAATALLEGNDLNNNANDGFLVSQGAIVDAGQVGGGATDFTGLGISSGGNNFSSYIPAGTAFAIRDENANPPNDQPGPQGAPFDLTAQGNVFFSSSTADIELVVDHDVDDSVQGFVDFSFAIAKDPGFSYVDANNDHLFNPADGDVPLDDGELNDGVFNTAIAEGPDYTVPISGAGLVINGPAISTLNMNYSADGDLVVNTDLTARQRRGTLALTSVAASVLFDDPTVTTSGNLIITAAGDFISEDDALLATSAGSRVDIDAGGEIVLRGTKVVAGKEIEMDAGLEIRMRNSAAGTTTLTATLSSIGKIDLNALDVELILVEATAREDIVITGEVVEIIASQLTANGTSVAAIDMQGLIAVDIADSTLTARKAVEVEAGLIDLLDSTVEAVGAGATSVELTSDSHINMTDTTVSASQTVHVSAGGSIFAGGATSLQADTTSDATVSLEALDDILADGISVQARLKVEMDAGGSLSADGSSLNAVSPSSGEIDLDALDDVFLNAADLHAGWAIDIDALLGNIEANGSNLLACNSPSSVVTLSADGDILLVGATIRAAALIDITGGALVDVQASNIGIWRVGSGDISIAGDTIDVDGATLKAPGTLSLLATTAVIGTALDDTPGILACP